MADICICTRPRNCSTAPSESLALQLKLVVVGMRWLSAPCSVLGLERADRESHGLRVALRLSPAENRRNCRKTQNRSCRLGQTIHLDSGPPQPYGPVYEFHCENIAECGGFSAAPKHSECTGITLCAVLHTEKECDLVHI